jgi:diguanylate cyclase (GGDEF)-like protein
MKHQTFSLRRQYIRLSVPLIISLFLLSFLVMSIGSYRSATHEYRNFRTTIKELVQKNLLLLQQVNRIYDLALGSEIEEKLIVFSDLFFEKGNNPDSIDLNALKENWGSTWDLYIINSENTIIKTTYPPDLGLNFQIASVPFSEQLTNIRQGNAPVIDIIGPESSGLGYRKWGYIPSEDNAYVLEVGLEIPIEDSMFEFLNPGYISRLYEEVSDNSIQISVYSQAEIAEGLNENIGSIRKDMVQTNEDYLEIIDWNTQEIKSYLNFEYRANYPTFISYFVEVNYSFQPIMDKILSDFLYLALLLAIMSLLGFFFFVQLSKYLTNPIQTMVSDISVIASGTWNHPIANMKSLELQSLKNSVQHLVQSLLIEKNTVLDHERKFQLAVKASRDVIFEWFPTIHDLHFSADLSHIIGSEPIDLHSRGLELWFFKLFNSESKSALWKIYQEFLQKNDFKFAIELQLQENSERWILVKGAMERTENGPHIIGILADISLMKKRQKSIEKLAFNDRISGFPNLQSFIYSKKVESPTPAGIILVDLDDFSRVNTTFGYKWRDLVIQAFCTEIQRIVNDSQSNGSWELFHINMDEILLVLSKIEEKTTIQSEIEKLFENLCMGLYLSIEKEFNFTTSIGATIADSINSTNKVNLLQEAEIALSQAKFKGKNNLVFYHLDESKSHTSTYTMIHEVWKSIKNNSMHLVYQPIVNINNPQESCCEALLRFDNQDNVSPELFIQAAEASGLIHLLGSWILDTSFEFARRIQISNLSIQYVSVNISPLQFREYEISRKLIAKCKHWKLNPKTIQFEITETALMQSSHTMIENLTELRNFGFRIALDDFGTGFSSLAYLTKLPIDAIKIDKSLTNEILVESKSASVVKMILSLAQELSIDVICEGIEEARQRDFLIENNCMYHQGYFYNKALTENELISWIKSLHHP